MIKILIRDHGHTQMTDFVSLCICSIIQLYERKWKMTFNLQRKLEQVSAQYIWRELLMFSNLKVPHFKEVVTGY